MSMDNTIIGYASLVVAVAGLAHYNVLWRLIRDRAGDGIFALFVTATAVWTTGLAGHLILGAVAHRFEFSLVAMSGGFAWSLGNSFLPFIFETLGVGLGVLLFSTVVVLFGWFSAHFGLLVNAETVPNPIPNYIGVALAFVSFVGFFFLRPTIQASEIKYSAKVRFRRRIAGFILGIVAGCLAGFNTLPLVYEEQETGIRQIFFAFSYFSGVYIFYVLLLLGYCIVKRNAPFLNPKIFLHSILIGVIFAITQFAVFQANSSLSVVVALPIVVLSPALITSLYSVFYFKEISGRRNYITLGVAFSFAVAGTVMIAVSKQ